MSEFLDELVQARVSRRAALQGSLAVAAASFFGCKAAGDKGARIGFAGVPTSRQDAVVVPPGYTWHVVNAWGDPIMPGAPEFKQDASQSAAEQAMQSGMHHDGMAYFPLEGTTRGLIAINFEYSDNNMLISEGILPPTAEKIQKSKNAHGLGVFEVAFDGRRWRTVKDSRYGRRITVDSPFLIKGPAAGHALMKTEADPTGTRALGTFNNCAAGATPWGTYLSCEENVTPYFVNDSKTPTRLQERYGVPPEKESWGHLWQTFDPRFDAAKHPNEVHRHGWVVELDPFDPASTPVKHTALGRMAHEGATVAEAPDGRVVVYMGDDDFRSKFEHLYKFVSARPHVKGGGYKANKDILDHGILYAAQFNADGSGLWKELTCGQHGIDASRGFPTPAEVVIDARTAADIAGATYMDRPEWVVVHPETGEVYCTLSNNTSRGKGMPSGRKEPLGADKANPRAPNLMGHILRWREEKADPAATRFEWDVFLQAGDPGHAEEVKRGNVKGEVAFGQPDGLYIDPRGVLWIQTDASSFNMSTKDWQNIGNNQMLAADPATGEVRRFLTGPVGCEITAALMTPDLKTMFVNIQHPGESPLPHPARSDPKKPKAYSSWPDGEKAGRPRSATIAIRREDGGIIGA